MKTPTLVKFVIGFLLALMVVMVVTQNLARQSMTTERYVYDAQGRLIRITDPAGDTSSFAYNNQGLITSIRTPDNETHYSYDSRGNRTQMRDVSGSINYQYDVFNRLVNVATIRGSINKQIEYEYNPWGQVARKSIRQDGRLEYQVEYEYDIAGNVTSIDDGNRPTSFEYRPDKGETIRVLPNRIKTVYLRSTSNELTDLKHYGPNGVLIAAYHYEYDVEGRLTLASEQTGQERQEAKFTRYEWEGDRLTAVRSANGGTISYQYDAQGNRLSKKEAGNSTNYKYDDFGNLVEEGNTSFTWDPKGNLTEQHASDGRMAIEYDSQSLPTLVETPKQRVELAWDGDGNMVSKRTDGGKTSHFLSDPLGPSSSILAEYGENGILETAYLYGNGNAPMGERDKNGDNRYFLEDGLGYARLTVGADGVISEGSKNASFGGLSDIDGAEIERAAIENVSKNMGKKVVGFEFALTRIPDVRNAGTLITLWDIYHKSEVLSAVRRKGPDSLRGDPAVGHLVMAWDLIKGPKNVPSQALATSTNRLYDDGTLRSQTQEVRRLARRFSTTAPFVEGDYGWDPSTDSEVIQTSIHTVRNETFDGSRFNRLYQNQKGPFANAGPSGDADQRLREQLAALSRTDVAKYVGRLVEQKKKKSDDLTGDPPDPPDGGGGGAAVNPFEPNGSLQDPLAEIDSDNDFESRADRMLAQLSNPGGIDLSIEPKYRLDVRLADLEEAVKSALADPNADPVFRVTYEGKQRKAMVLDLNKAGRDMWNKWTRSKKTSAYALRRDGKPAKVRDRRGNIVEFGYDAAGGLRSASLRSRAGSRGRVECLKDGSRMTFVDNGHTVVRRFGAGGHLSKLTVDGKVYATITYDEISREATMRYKGFEEKVVYDADGRLERYRVQPLNDNGNPEGRVRELAFQHDAEGRVSNISGDQQARIAYDGDDLREIQAGSTGVLITRDPRTNKPTSLTTTWGMSVQFGYEGGELKTASARYKDQRAEDVYENGRLTQTLNFSGEKTIYSYTPAGNIGSVTDTRRRKVAYSYDKSNRLREVRLPDGRRLEYRYSTGPDGETSVELVNHVRQR